MSTVPSNVIPFKVPSIAREAYQYEQREQLREERAHRVTSDLVKGFAKIPPSFGGRQALQTEFDEVMNLRMQYEAGNKDVYQDLVMRKEKLMAAISGAQAMITLVMKDFGEFKKSPSSFTTTEEELNQGFSDFLGKSWTVDELIDPNGMLDQYYNVAPKEAVKPPKYVNPDAAKDAFYESPNRFLKPVVSANEVSYIFNEQEFIEHAVNDLQRMMKVDPSLMESVIFYNEGIEGRDLSKINEETVRELTLKYQNPDVLNQAVKMYASDIASRLKLQYEKTTPRVSSPLDSPSNQRTLTEKERVFNFLLQKAKRNANGMISIDVSLNDYTTSEVVRELDEKTNEPKDVKKTKVLQKIEMSDDANDVILYWNNGTTSTGEPAISYLTKTFGTAWQGGFQTAEQKPKRTTQTKSGGAMSVFNKNQEQ